MITVKKFLTIAICAVAVIGSGPAKSADTKLVIVNRTKHVIRNINVTPPKSPAFGKQDLLEGKVLRPGDARVIDFNVTDAENLCYLSFKFNAGEDMLWSERMNVCNRMLWEITLD